MDTDFFDTNDTSTEPSWNQTNITQSMATDFFDTNDTSTEPSWNQTSITTQSNTRAEQRNVDISTELAEEISFGFECVTMPILVLIGVIGSILSLVVLSHRRLRRSSTTVLLIGLALSDCMYLITTMVRKSTCIISTVDKLFSYKYFVLSFNSVYYINTCFSRVSTLLIAVLSVERLVAVVFPLKVKLLCTKTRMTAAVVTVYVFTFAFLALLPMQYDIKYRNDMPYLKANTFFLENQQFVDIYNKYITVAVLRWLPKVIVVMCNGIIITKLWKRRIPTENTENAPKTTTSNNTQRKVTIMLVAVAIVFVVTLLPGDVFWICTLAVDGFKLYGRYNNLFAIFSNVAMTFEIINASGNFVIYMVLNSTFTEVYLALFCPCHSVRRRLHQAGQPRQSTSGSTKREEKPRFSDNAPSTRTVTSGSSEVSRDSLYTV